MTDKEKELALIKDMQEVCAQMVHDDIDENPSCASEFFDCAACGQAKSYAGSIQYGDFRLCNGCVLYAEVGLKLGKFKNISELVDALEEKRLEEICEFIKLDRASANN